MAYDEDLANRIRELTASERGVEEKLVFGGLAFLIGGHLSVAASGWVRVTGAGVRTTQQLQSWVSRGVAQARSLPPK